MITCYLAGPIDYDKEDDGSWKTELIERIKSGGDDIAFFDPAAPYRFNTVNEDVARYIHDVNMYALGAADILVGRLMSGQASIGTPIEFYHVMKSDKPMIICTDMEKSIYMKYISTKAILFPNMELLYNKLVEFAEAHEARRNQFRESLSNKGMMEGVNLFKKELVRYQDMSELNKKFAIERGDAECVKL